MVLDLIRSFKNCVCAAGIIGSSAPSIFYIRGAYRCGKLTWIIAKLCLLPSFNSLDHCALVAWPIYSYIGLVLFLLYVNDIYYCNLPSQFPVPYTCIGGNFQGMKFV